MNPSLARSPKSYHLCGPPDQSGLKARAVRSVESSPPRRTRGPEPSWGKGLRPRPWPIPCCKPKQAMALWAGVRPLWRCPSWQEHQGRIAGSSGPPCCGGSSEEATRTPAAGASGAKGPDLALPGPWNPVHANQRCLQLQRRSGACRPLRGAGLQRPPQGGLRELLGKLLTGPRRLGLSPQKNPDQGPGFQVELWLLDELENPNGFRTGRG